jgi:hypothetical protein
MMRDYWDHVKGQHKRSCSAKLKMAQPLFDLINEYKNAHFDVYARWAEEQVLQDRQFQPDSTGITRAWIASFPGQLEKRLLRLCTEYTVFSFYG